MSAMEEQSLKDYISLRKLRKYIISPKGGNYYISLATLSKLVRKGVIVPDYVPPSKRKFCFLREHANEIVRKFKYREIDPYNLKAREQKKVAQSDEKVSPTVEAQKP
ncbi:MAG: hypothetical protein ACP5KW_12100 [Thermoproteota archaeon]